MIRNILASLACAGTLLFAAPPSAAAPRVPVWRPSPASTTVAVAEPRAAGWTHAGCWARSAGGTCYDIYIDAAGDRWICKACGTTRSPGPGKCSRISQRELDSGLWCS